MKVYPIYMTYKGGKDLVAIHHDRIRAKEAANEFAEYYVKEISFKVYEMISDIFWKPETKYKPFYITKGKL